MNDEAACNTCGAPDEGENVHCRYCGQAYSAELARTAIPCRRCGHANRWGKQRCVRCQEWIVVSCVFCGALSPHSVSNCLQCNEAFAGSGERKAAMQSQRDVQQVAQVMNAAAPILGIALGVALSSDWDD